MNNDINNNLTGDLNSGINNNLTDNTNNTESQENILEIKKRPEKSFDEQNEFDSKLLKLFIGKRYGGFLSKKINIGALLFGPLYLIYRRIYLIGVLAYTIFSALLIFFYDNYLVLGIIFGINLIFNIIVCILFNKYYLNKAYNKIKEIQEKNEYITDLQIESMAEEEGEPSVGVVIVAVIVISGILYLVVPLLKGLLTFNI